VGDSTGVAFGYPFLMPEVLEVALRLPDAHKRAGSQAKPVLKALGAEFVARLAMPEDFELLWTLAALEELLAALFPETDSGSLTCAEA
jgi:hypothetical protein